MTPPVLPPPSTPFPLVAPPPDDDDDTLSDDSALSDELAAMSLDALTSFYTTHAPDKVKDVDSILDQYAGREQSTLWRQLATKYPAAADECRAVVRSLSERSEAVEAEDRKLEGQLRAFYATHCPEKLLSASAERDLRRACRMYRGREQDLFAALRRKYPSS